MQQSWNLLSFDAKRYDPIENAPKKSALVSASERAYLETMRDFVKITILAGAMVMTSVPAAFVPRPAGPVPAAAARKAKVGAKKRPRARGAPL